MLSPWDLSSATAPLVLTLFVGISHQNLHKTDKHSDEVDEKLLGMPHKVVTLVVYVLDDHLGVKDDVAHEHDEASVKMNEKHAL